MTGPEGSVYGSLDLDAHQPAVNKTGKGVELVCSCGEDLGCVPNDVDVVLDLLDLWGGHTNELGYMLGKRVKADEIRQALKEEL